MGTSTPFPTQSPNTPLLPDWANPPDLTDNLPELPDVPDDPSDPGDNGIPNEPTFPANPPDLKPPPIPDDKDRLRDFRKSMTDYVKSSGDKKGRLGSGLRNYIRRSSGGAKNAALRMGSASRSAAALYNVLHQISKDGVNTTLLKYSLDDIINLPPQEVLANLIDIVCGVNGDKDTGLVRESYIETLCESEVFGDLIELDSISQDHISSILIEFISTSIVSRIENDLASKIENLSITPDQAIKQKREITGFIKAAVRDKLLSELNISPSINIKDLEKKMLDIYEISYELIDEKAGEL